MNLFWYKLKMVYKLIELSRKEMIMSKVKIKLLLNFIWCLRRLMHILPAKRSDFYLFIC